MTYFLHEEYYLSIVSNLQRSPTIFRQRITQYVRRKFHFPASGNFLLWSTQNTCSNPWYDLFPSWGVLFKYRIKFTEVSKYISWRNDLYSLSLSLLLQTVSHHRCHAASPESMVEIINFSKKKLIKCTISQPLRAKKTVDYLNSVKKY